MLTREDLKQLVLDALAVTGGSATIANVAKEIWRRREADLRDAGDLFYTWQYDMRWAATYLRKEGKLVNADLSPAGVWELKNT